MKTTIVILLVLSLYELRRTENYYFQGFEDCLVFSEILDEMNDDIRKIFFL